MYLSRSEYDRGVNTFSPEGRLFQVEYAMEAIKLGTTVLGIRTSDGVVLAAEKRITSSLLIPNSIEKIIEVDAHVAMALSGVSADSRMIIDHARLDAAKHTFVYEEPIPLESIARGIGDLALKFGEGMEGKKSTMSRPFGVSILIGGIDSSKDPYLYQIDPSGTYLTFDAKAIGAGSEAAMITLESSYNKVGMQFNVKDMTLHEGIKLALSILKQVMEEKLNPRNVEVVTVTPKDGFKMILPDDLSKFMEDGHVTE